MNPFKKSCLILVTVIVYGITPSVHAADAGTDANAGWYTRWLDQVTAIQSEQPRWMTPIFTTTPRLEQEFRYDILLENASNGNELDNYGNGKGLEIIPFDPVELIIGVPPYLNKNTTGAVNGWGDLPTLIKYRILSANEEKGNYILTAFLGASFPTGTKPIGGVAVILTPTIAAGMGSGDFDLQTTVGIALPLADEASIGQTLSWNTALQYHFVPMFWPQLELNMSHFTDGEHNGLTQVFVSPGVVIGRFGIHERTSFSVGLGYQVAATTFHTYNNAATLTMRLPF